MLYASVHDPIVELPSGYNDKKQCCCVEQRWKEKGNLFSKFCMQQLYFRRFGVIYMIFFDIRCLCRDESELSIFRHVKQPAVSSRVDIYLLLPSRLLIATDQLLSKRILELFTV